MNAINPLPQSMSEVKQVAHEAKELLANPLLIAVLQQLESETLAQWRATADDAIALRERLYLQLKLLDQFRCLLSERIVEERYQDFLAEQAAQKLV